MSRLDDAPEVDLEGAWQQMEPEQREAVRRIAERRASLSAEEQQGAAEAGRREMIEQQADQAVEAVLDAGRRGRTAALLPRLAEMSAYFRSGQAANSQYADLAGFLDAVAAVLRGEKPPAVAAEYAERLATVERAVGYSDHDPLNGGLATEVTKSAKREDREGPFRG